MSWYIQFLVSCCKITGLAVTAEKPGAGRSCEAGEQLSFRIGFHNPSRWVRWREKYIHITQYCNSNSRKDRNSKSRREINKISMSLERVGTAGTTNAERSGKH